MKSNGKKLTNKIKQKHRYIEQTDTCQRGGRVEGLEKKKVKGKQRWEEMKAGKGGINGDGKRLLWMMRAQCSAQVMFC